MLIDFKYSASDPNIFTCRDNGVPNFWKGVLWAANVAKMGFRWKIGNWCNVRFWEDAWLGSSSLAIQYWEIYVIINEHNKTIADIWDGSNLKCTFRRCVDARLYNMWEELVSIASSICLSDSEDEMVWQFHSSGLYSSHSLYKVINFRGVFPMYVPSVWKLCTQPRVHFFLWLLSNNMLLTRDNLSKKRRLHDCSCLFCMEEESISHLFFDCVVARNAWKVLSAILGIEAGNIFESRAKLWLCNKKFAIANMFTSAVCWGIWKLRNDLCF
jgi:hypothetical protein